MALSFFEPSALINETFSIYIMSTKGRNNNARQVEHCLQNYIVTTM